MQLYNMRSIFKCAGRLDHCFSDRIKLLAIFNEYVHSTVVMSLNTKLNIVIIIESTGRCRA